MRLRRTDPARSDRASLLRCCLVLCLAAPLLPSPGFAAGTEDPNDSRDAFEAWITAAESIDTFAAKDVAAYLNPEDAGGLRTRLTALADTSTRLLDQTLGSSRLKVWLLAGTAYGVRSTDVNCARVDPSGKTAICQDIDPNNAPRKVLYVIRNATSMEGYVGARVEWKPGALDGAFYAIGQDSFAAVSGQSGDFREISHYGIGLVSTGKNYHDSQLEIGRVNDQLFQPGQTRRWRIDGILRWSASPDLVKKKIANRSTVSQVFSAFLRTTVEFDRGDGPDSAITSFGVSIRPDAFFRIFNGS